MAREETTPPLDASTTETAKPSNQALYDAQEYLVAGSANHAEWWAHLGDAHRDYAALAQAATDLVARVEALLAERDALQEQLLGGLCSAESRVEVGREGD